MKLYGGGQVETHPPMINGVISSTIRYKAFYFCVVNRKGIVEYV
jgi:hypothetical protein